METYDPTSTMYSSYGQLLNQILETMKTRGIDKKSIGMFRNSRKDYINSGIGRSLVLYTLMARILHLQKIYYTNGLVYETERARREDYIAKNIKPQYREQARGYRDMDGFG